MYDAVELNPAESVGVIRQYVRSVPVTKNYWNIKNDSSDEEVIEDAQDHPVFRLLPRGR